jgi:hypothetical protein
MPLTPAGRVPVVPTGNETASVFWLMSSETRWGGSSRCRPALTRLSAWSVQMMLVPSVLQSWLTASVVSVATRFHNICAAAGAVQKTMQKEGRDSPVRSGAIVDTGGA